MNILITWTSSWIWNYLTKNLYLNNNIYSISRSDVDLKWITHFLWDINDDKFIDEIIDKIPNIDYLVLNAWIWYFDKFQNISLENHIEVLNTNLISNIKLVYKLINKINIWVIFIWSISSKKSSWNWASYSASKFWLRWFAMQLKNERLFKKIFFINPKIVKTNFHKNSKIEIVWKFKETNIDEILDVLKNILNENENRFEIDL